MIRFIVNLIIGGVSGWLAGKIMKSEGSLLRNVILGVVGGFVGGLIGSIIGIGATGWIGSVIISTLGACLCIWLAKKYLK